MDFRFAHRNGAATTAHEAGVFLYTQKIAGSKPKPESIGFEAFLVKEADGWKIMMEY